MRFIVIDLLMRTVLRGTTIVITDLLQHTELTIQNPNALVVRKLAQLLDSRLTKFGNMTKLSRG